MDQPVLVRAARPQTLPGSSQRRFGLRSAVTATSYDIIPGGAWSAGLRPLRPPRSAEPNASARTPAESARTRALPVALAGSAPRPRRRALIRLASNRLCYKLLQI